MLPFTLLFWVHIYRTFLCFLSRKDPLTFVEELAWWCWILSAFALSVKLLISPLSWMRSLLGRVILVVGFSVSSLLSMSCHSLLVWRVSIERSSVILMEIPLCVICCFSLAAFNICSLCFIFVSLINMCLRFILLGLSSFLEFGGCFLPHFRKVFNYHLKYFLMPFLFVFFFFFFLGHLWFKCWGIYIVSEVSEVVLISFNSFSPSASLTSTILSSTSLICSSASVILLSVPSRMFLFWYCSVCYWLTVLYFF